jgi:hypothetical protein
LRSGSLELHVSLLEENRPIFDGGMYTIPRSITPQKKHFGMVILGPNPIGIKGWNVHALMNRIS